MASAELNLLTQHDQAHHGLCPAGMLHPGGPVEFPVTSRREPLDPTRVILGVTPSGTQPKIDPHRVVHVPLAEVHHALPLRGDGDGRDG